MDSELKKAVMLFRSLIFHYHGLDEEERTILESAAKKLDAMEELEWANDFIAEDYLSAFERSREFLIKIFPKLSERERVKHLKQVWEDNHRKGYVTEMETTGMFTLAKDWGVESEFLKVVQM